MHLSYPVRTNTIRRVQLLLAQSTRTVLTTCHPSPPCLSSRPQPSSSATSTVIPKTLGTPYHGGMTDGPLILAFHAWPWIIWPYLVSVYIIISFPPFTGFTATSIEVEWLFSRGRLVISHVHSRLGVQGSRALICLGVWSHLGLIKSTDIKTVSAMEEVEGENHIDLGDRWDNIVI